MAAANKPTAVHFSLVFFVMCTLILAVTTYLFKKDQNQALKDKDAADKALAAKTSEFNQLQAGVTDLKALLGIPQSQIGGAGDSGQDTVSGTLRATMTQQGGDFVANTTVQTLAQMRTQIDNLTQQVQTLTDGLNANNRQQQQENQASQTRVDQFQQSAQKYAGDRGQQPV